MKIKFFRYIFNFEKYWTEKYWNQKKVLINTNTTISESIENNQYEYFFKRGASEAAEGCLVSVAAKLVKTAAKIITLLHARGNKSAAAKFGPKIGKFGAKVLRLKFQHTCEWK